MRIHNQTMYSVAATLNYMWWVGQIRMNHQDAADFAYFLSTQESTYISFDRFCEQLTKFGRGYKFFIESEHSSMYKMIYIQSVDEQTIVPLLVFTPRHGVIENTIEIVSIGKYDIPANLQEVVQDE